MNNFNQFKIKKARSEKICKNCKIIIKPNEEYYGEDPKNVIFAGIHKNNYCIKCYEKNR